MPKSKIRKKAANIKKNRRETTQSRSKRIREMKATLKLLSQYEAALLELDTNRVLEGEQVGATAADVIVEAAMRDPEVAAQIEALGDIAEESPEQARLALVEVLQKTGASVDRVVEPQQDEE